MHWRHVSITTTPCWGSSRLVALRAHVLLAERIGAHPLSHCAHPGQLGGEACQGFALWLHAWRWCTWRASFDPQHHGGALLWRHMHMVYRAQGETAGASALARVYSQLFYDSGHDWLFIYFLFVFFFCILYFVLFFLFFFFFLFEDTIEKFRLLISKIYMQLTWNLPETYPKFTRNLPKLTQNLPETYPTIFSMNWLDLGKVDCNWKLSNYKCMHAEYWFIIWNVCARRRRHSSRQRSSRIFLVFYVIHV